MTSVNDVKVALVGLDGVPPQLLKLIIEDNQRQLKFLNTIEQTYGIHKLTSVIPYISPAAWTSMFTGTFPIRHRIFDFMKLIYNDNMFQIKPINIHDVKREFIWKYLSDYGFRSIVANVPSFYPAVSLKGIMISGPPNPLLTTYPHFIKKILLKKFDYKVDIEDFNINFIQDRNKTLKLIKKIEHNRIKAFKYLISNFKWTLFIGCFLFTDNILHFIIKKIQDYFNGVLPEPPYEYKIFVEVLSEVDTLIEQLFNLSDMIILVSDHGMKTYEKKFLINSWLYQNGYLKLKGQRKKILKIDSLTNNRLLFKLLYNPLNKVRFIRELLYDKVKKLATDRFDITSLDYNRTQMFAYNTNMPVGLIKILRKKTIVTSRIKEELNHLLNREKNSFKVLTLNEIYNTSNEQSLNGFDMPDLLILSNRYVFSAFSLGTNIVTDLKRPGDHDIYGFITYISKHHIDLNVNNAKIVDITPTILDIIFSFDKITKNLKFDGKSLRC